MLTNNVCTDQIFFRENETHKATTKSLPEDQRLMLIIIKKRPCHQIDIVIPANHRAKRKESEKIEPYLDLPRELKKLWNMKMTL